METNGLFHIRKMRWRNASGTRRDAGRGKLTTTILILSILLILGCSSQRPFAVVDDVTVPSRLDTGYKLIEVDGMPVKRARGRVVTMIPVALVEPGKHTFTWEDSGTPKKVISVFAVVDADKSYRLADRDGAFVLVEDLD
ncbi:MAG: hypothetical protein WD648_10655 [Planctomycetaceae bacterium]